MIHCPEIFHSIFITTVNNNNIEISPCCQSYQQPIKNSEFNFNDSTYLNKLRVENLNNIKSAECNRCWHAEENKLQSKRQSANNFYNNKVDTNTELHILEYNTTWACNLACIMCDPKFSSTLAHELGIDIETKSQNIERKLNPIIDHLDLSKLKRIHFNGGEPLINSEHINTLDRVINPSDCSISYNTNGTKIPTDRVLDTWSKFKSVRIFFSIDAINTAFDYIRWNAKWVQVNKNLQWFINNTPNNVMFGINATVGVYNLLEIPKLYNWYTESFSSNRDGDKTEFNWQTAYNYNFDWGSTEVKEETLLNLQTDNILVSLQTALNASLLHKQDDKWINALDTIDNRRGTNWRTSLKIGKFY